MGVVVSGRQGLGAGVCAAPNGLKRSLGFSSAHHKSPRSCWTGCAETSLLTSSPVVAEYQHNTLAPMLAMLSALLLAVNPTRVEAGAQGTGL